MSLLTRLAAETHLLGGEFLQAAVNRVEFVKLRGRTRIPAGSKWDGQHCKQEQTGIKWSIAIKSSIVQGTKP
jgi:hypothetical protein